ncbi:MAG: NAD(P)-dependent oxidoreductase [Gammaproteobacteria bacterium]|nr:MAG: NAD(P)-dependent oxidoreductase [Gammaproteobacteria bacterium]
MSTGYVGLGNMGGAIARRILLQQSMQVFDARPEAVQAFVKEGATATANLAEIGQNCDRVFICLPTSKQVRQVIFEPGGLAEHLAKGSLVVDMTTGDPVATKEMAAELADRGIDMIDAPVSGGPIGAERGTLAIMIGGPELLYQKARSVLDAVSPNIFHTGDIGTGHTMKLVNNVIAACNRAMAFEAVTLGVKNGLDPAVCVDILQKSSGRSYTTEVTFPQYILSGKPIQGFTLGLMHKGVALATKLGEDSDTPMHLANVVKEIFQSALNVRGRDADINTLLELMEDAANTRVNPLP